MEREVLGTIFIICRRLKVVHIDCIMDVKYQEGAVNEPCKGYG